MKEIQKKGDKTAEKYLSKKIKIQFLQVVLKFEVCRLNGLVRIHRTEKVKDKQTNKYTVSLKRE